LLQYYIITNKLKTLNKTLILESAFDGNAKLYIYLVFLFILCVPFIGIVRSYGITRVFAVFLFTLVLFIGISIFNLQKGIVKNSKGFYIGYFTWGKLVLKSSIHLFNLPVITLLKFQRKSRGAFRSVANPKFSVSFNSFEIYLLNEKHTVKRKILTLKHEEKANFAIDFISLHSQLRKEVYRPDHS